MTPVLASGKENIGIEMKGEKGLNFHCIPMYPCIMFKFLPYPYI